MENFSAAQATEENTVQDVATTSCDKKVSWKGDVDSNSSIAEEELNIEAEKDQLENFLAMLQQKCEDLKLRHADMCRKMTEVSEEIKEFNEIIDMDYMEKLYACNVFEEAKEVIETEVKRLQKKNASLSRELKLKSEYNQKLKKSNEKQQRQLYKFLLYLRNHTPLAYIRNFLCVHLKPSGSNSLEVFRCLLKFQVLFKNHYLAPCDMKVSRRTL